MIERTGPPDRPSGEELARAGLRVDVSRNREQMAMVEESRQLLAALLRDEMRIAVADGIAAAMSEKNAALFVRAALTEAQKMAVEKSGEVAVGAISALFKKGLLFLFAGSVVYAVGGWSALASLGKFFAGTK